MQKVDGKIPVIVIFAPTASGKTALMYELFSCEGSQNFLNGRAEIISADSMQVYKKLDIGTAKPDVEFCKKIPHHLIDLVDFKTQFSVADFVANADECAREIYSRGKIPVVAGGTGFYIHSFLCGLPKTPESNEKIRSELEARLEKEGREALYEELCEKDPLSAKKIHKNDGYRICRALEIFYTAGIPRSKYSLETEFRDDFNFLSIILEPPRELLFQRIDERVDRMFEMGLVGEVKNLMAEGAVKTDPGMQAIGYREFFMCDFLAKKNHADCGTSSGLEKPFGVGKFTENFFEAGNSLGMGKSFGTGKFTENFSGSEGDLEKIKAMIKRDTKKYAKKQYTYIRDLPGMKGHPTTCGKKCHIVPYRANKEDVNVVKNIIKGFILHDNIL